MPEVPDVHLLVRMNDLEAIRVLMFMKPETKNMPRLRTAERPLHIACDCGHTDMLDLLLTYKPDIAAASSTGWTPLHVSANRGCLTAINKLIDSANGNVNQHLIDARDNSGMTPLMVACVAGQLEAAQLLIDSYSANPTLTNDMGDTPLHLCCHWGHAELVRYLLDLKVSYCVDVRKQNVHGNTPLHRACAKGFADIASMLTLRGANLLAVNHEGLTPVDVSTSECLKFIH
jgi:ankyrin repeat protein